MVVVDLVLLCCQQRREVRRGGVVCKGGVQCLSGDIAREVD